MDTHQITKEDLRCVTNRKPTEEEIEQLLFAWKVVKHVKSNAIVLVQRREQGPLHRLRLLCAGP